MKQFFISTILISSLVFSTPFLAFANQTSASFEFENPNSKVIEGGISSSSSFRYISSSGQFVQGQSTSTSFISNAGFLYFPVATSPVLSATAGDAQVSLSWTSATGILANITSYEVGVSTSSGGTYSFTNVGTSTSSIQTGLSNGTTY